MRRIRKQLPGSPPEAINLWFARWERYITLTTSIKTSQRYMKCLYTFFKYFPEKEQFTEFTRPDIEDFRIARLREGVNARTINYTVQIVGAFWRYLVDMGVTPWNPFQSVKRLKEKEPDRECLTLDQLEQLYRSVAEHGSLQDKLLVGLAFSTGLRGETLIQLEKADVDLEGRVLHLAPQKMKAGRNLALPLRQSEVDLIRQLPDGRLFQGYANVYRALLYRINKLYRRAGLKIRGIRAARRTFATILLRSGVDLKTVQGLLGHKDITTTSRYIMPADEQLSRSAIEKLPGPNPGVPEMQ